MPTPNINFLLPSLIYQQFLIQTKNKKIKKIRRRKMVVGKEDLLYVCVCIYQEKNINFLATASSSSQWNKKS